MADNKTTIPTIRAAALVRQTGRVAAALTVWQQERDVLARMFDGAVGEGASLADIARVTGHPKQTVHSIRRSARRTT